MDNVVHLRKDASTEKRSLSSSAVDDAKVISERKFRLRSDRPCHRPRDPLNLGSLVWNYSGVFNWAFLLLALVALKMFLENINKYGVRIDPRLWVKFAFGDLHFDRLEFPAVFVLVFANISLLVALKTEQGLAKESLVWKQALSIHTANLTGLLVLPVLYIQHKSECIGLVSSLLMCTLYTVLFMKLLSYVQVNKWCRDSIITNNNNDCIARRIRKSSQLPNERLVVEKATPSCLDTELRRRRFYSVTPASYMKEEDMRLKSQGSSSCFTPPPTGSTYTSGQQTFEMDEVEECGDTFFKDDNISHPSSKPLLVDDRLLGIKDHPRRHLTSTDRNADDERSDTSADPVRDAETDISANTSGDLAKDQLELSTEDRLTGSPLTTSDVSMLEYSFEEEEEKIGVEESAALYLKIQENTKSFNKPQRAEVRYPDNLTFSDLYYFWFAPTLCYEINFPRTRRIRTGFLLKRALEVFVCSQICLCVVQQYIMPSVVSALVPFSNMELSLVSERLLKLALPNHLLWLISFYLLFHSFLNTSAELLHFADRSFFKDWWNASNLETFWKNWNLPVHRWCVRHVYKPLLAQGYSKKVAMVVVFFISAAFHEYMVSVPLRMFKVWIGLGMVAQAPLVFLSRFIEKKFGARWGNMIVWLSLIIGQPLIIMSYYHDFVVEHYGSHLIGAQGHDHQACQCK